MRGALLIVVGKAASSAPVLSFAAMKDGALFTSDIASDALTEAFEAVVTSLGYTRAEPPDVEVKVTMHANRACVGIELPKSLALAVGRKIAKRLGRDVRVFTASVVEKGGSFECLVDDLSIRADGTSKVGRWGVDTNRLHGENWNDVCDGKSYVAVSALLGAAAQTALGEDGSQRSLTLRAPASLGTQRLDAIATQIRAAERVALAVMAGRECVRTTASGTTVTSFLAPDEIATLREHGLIIPT